MSSHKRIILPTIDGQSIDFLCNEPNKEYNGLPLYSSYGITMHKVRDYIAQRNIDIKTYTLADEQVNKAFKRTSIIGMAVLSLSCYLAIKIFVLQLLLMITMPILFYKILQHYCIKRLILSHYDCRIEQFIDDVTEYARVYESKQIIELKNSTFKSANQKGNAVDLGLSVLWADSNIGAYCFGYSNENGIECEVDLNGSYFDWGETGPNQFYSFLNTNILELERNQILNEKRILSEQYDAATINWGRPWRMPTYEEVQELINLCRWEKGNKDGYDGCWVIGPNGNSIFLPFGGMRKAGKIISEERSGLYWIAQLKNIKDQFADALIVSTCVDNNEVIVSNTALLYRNTGCSIRAVADKGAIVPINDLYEAFDF